jgi:tRNA uridine 5-carboxymethylaminomethyl modification enzyme
LGRSIEREYALADLLKRPEVTYAGLLSLRLADGTAVGGPAETVAVDAAVAEQVEIQIKYAGYIARQDDEVLRHESSESTRIPERLDYDAVRGLSIEVRQKLKVQRPETVGQASRISGVTPAAISLLLVHIKRLNKAGGGKLAA